MPAVSQRAEAITVKVNHINLGETWALSMSKI